MTEDATPATEFIEPPTKVAASKPARRKSAPAKRAASKPAAKKAGEVASPLTEPIKITLTECTRETARFKVFETPDKTGAAICTVYAPKGATEIKILIQ